MLTRRSAGVACLVLFTNATTATAQQQDPSRDYNLDYSSVPMRRNAEWVDLGARVLERSVDWGFRELTGDLMTRKSTGGVLARAARWSAFDFVLAGFASVVTHEYGHKARVEELGREATVYIRLFGSSSFRPRGALFTPRETLNVFAGGLEGARVLADQVEDRIYARGVASAGDLTAVFVNALASQGYILSTLSGSRLSSPERFIDGAGQACRATLPTTPRTWPECAAGAGAKGAGYVRGYPIDAGAYFNVGVGLRF